MKYYVNFSREITYKDVPVDVRVADLIRVKNNPSFLVTLADRQLGEADMIDYIDTDVKDYETSVCEGIVCSPDMEHTLTAFWKYFCDVNELPHESADELLAEMHMNSDLVFTPEQQEVVEAFICLWEIVI